jgi:hypothetical protein
VRAEPNERGDFVLAAVDDAVHTRETLGVRNLHGADRGVGVRASQEGDVQRAGQPQVVQVPTAAAEKARVVTTWNRYTDMAP